MGKYDKWQAISDEMIVAMGKIAAKHNMSIVLQRGIVADDESRISLFYDMAKREEDVIQDSFANDFKTNARSWGLQITDLGKTFYHGTKEYRIIGAAPRSHKSVIVEYADKPDSKRFKFTPEDVKASMGNKAPQRSTTTPAAADPKFTGGKRPDAEITREMRRVQHELQSKVIDNQGMLDAAAVKLKRSQLEERFRQLRRELGRRETDDELAPKRDDNK
jgi:hypothetical protein